MDELKQILERLAWRWAKTATGIERRGGDIVVSDAPGQGQASSRDLPDSAFIQKTWTKPSPPDTADALGRTTADYTLSSLRYDLSKLRAKGLVERLHKSRRYRLTAEGYRICVVFLKLFEQIYAPLASAILKPFNPDSQLQSAKTTLLDRVYTSAHN